MTDTITPASLQAHADWMRGRNLHGPANSFEAEALRLEAESARDEEAERYAKVYRRAQRRVYPTLAKWGSLDAETQENYTRPMRAVLDRLAADGRLLPEGGTDLLPCDRCNGSGSEPAVSVPDSGPDGTPEKPWPTWQDVPEGVRYTDQADPNAVDGWWVNRGGQRFSVNRRDGHEFASALSDSKMQRLAPFVRVDGDKA
ncbi:hypothetical protein GTG23_00320 [Rhodococcus hoagii]|nr:hypothetical protein [Prescottella equi]